MAYLSFNKLLPSVNTVVKTANQLAQRVILVKLRPVENTSDVSRLREESFTKQFCVEATVIKIEFQLCLSQKQVTAELKSHSFHREFHSQSVSFVSSFDRRLGVVVDKFVRTPNIDYDTVYSLTSTTLSWDLFHYRSNF